MGFDCFMEVLGECSLKEFIQITKDNWLKSHYDDSCYDDTKKDEFVRKAQEWAIISDNQISFIERIEEITFENFELHVGFYGKESDKNEENKENEDIADESFHLMNYSTLIFSEIILFAIEQEDSILIKCLKVISDIGEDLSAKKDNIKITLSYYSSYKGSEKLDIDYCELNQKINQIKNIYPSIYIYTKLGMS